MKNNTPASMYLYYREICRTHIVLNNPIIAMKNIDNMCLSIEKLGEEVSYMRKDREKSVEVNLFF